MKHLGIAALALFAIVACNHKKEEAPAAKGSAAGSAMTGSAAAGSAMTGSAEAGSAMAGSAMAGSAMTGSATGSDAGSAAAGSAAMGSAGSDSFNWEAMSHEERMDYMKHTVVPTMKPLFQKFDAKHYANFGCKTCHGKDPKKAKFKMPTPDLPKLDFAALKAGKQKPEIAKWMGEVVEPNMADLLHKPKYNPAAPDPSQFGCLGCHEQKK